MRKTPNGKNGAVSELFEEFIEKHVTIEGIAADFAQLTPYRRLAMLEKFAAYVSPKMKSIEMDVSHESVSPDMFTLMRHLKDSASQSESQSKN